MNFRFLEFVNKNKEEDGIQGESSLNPMITLTMCDTYV